MVTLFLTQVLGWYLIVMGLLLLVRHEHIKSVLSELTQSSGLFFIFALLTFLIGLLMVVSHNIWIVGWPLIITLFSWLVLISGLIRLFFPDLAPKANQAFSNHPLTLNVTAIALILIGLYFLLKIYNLHF